jgi:acetyl-CoA carboxylase carboxyltransferase component
VSVIQKVIDARGKAMTDTPARKRIELLLDSGSFVELGGLAKAGDEPAGVVCGYGSVAGMPVAVFAQDSTEQGGAVGKAHAAKIAKVYDLALKTGVPVVGVYDSHGARLREGFGALAAYGEILTRVNNLSGVVPQISLVLGTCAGTSAMLACSADFVLMSEKAELFMAAPGKDETAGKAKATAKSGVAHIIAADDEAVIAEAKKLIALLPINNLAACPLQDFDEPENGESQLAAACEAISGAKAADLAGAVLDQGSAVELLADFGTAAYTAIATMGGLSCGVVSASGLLDRDASAKIAKLVSVCDAYQIPVVTLVNTEGMVSTSESELGGSIRDMARMAHVYAEATTAKVALFAGAAYGAAAVALASSSDYSIAWPSAVISALAPKTAVAFLYSDKITAENPRAKVEADYAENEASAFAAAAAGYIDDVIDPGLTRPAILSALDLLSAKRVESNPKKHGNIPL